VRGKFDPRRVAARPQPPRLRGRTIDAAALLTGGLPGQLDAELIVDFDTLGRAGELAEQHARLVAALHERGVRVHGRFTLGYDHDELDAFERLVAWVEQVGVERVALRLWTPELGSEQARVLAQAGRLRHLDHARWDGAHVVVEPLTMSPEALQRGWAWAQTRLDSLGSRLRRRERAASRRGNTGPLTRLFAWLRSLAQLASARRPGLVRVRGGV
jgi:hypothetical protein